MAGLNIVIPRAGGIGPIVDPLHSAGVDGYSHRYVASRLDQPVNTAITEFSDLGSSPEPLLHSNGVNTLRAEAGIVYAELVASSGTNANYNLESSATSYLPQVTIAAVVRVPDSQVRIFETGTLGLIRATSGQFQVARSNGSAGSLLVAGTGSWAFIIAQGDATALTSLLRLNATETTGTFTTANTGATATRMGGNQGAASKTTHVAESITWSRVLNSTERTAVHNAMKAKYSVLP